MGGHLLGDLEAAAVLDVGGDFGRPAGAAADLGLDPGRERSPANHPPNVRLEQGIASEHATGRAWCGRADPSLLGDAGRPSSQ